MRSRRNNSSCGAAHRPAARMLTATRRQWCATGTGRTACAPMGARTARVDVLPDGPATVSYTHLRAHETLMNL
eukprot:490746-Prymnesium_polylepis.1